MSFPMEIYLVIAEHLEDAKALLSFCMARIYIVYKHTR